MSIAARLWQTARAVRLTLLLVALVLGGCVTTTESEYGRADKTAEVKSRVDAANAYLQRGNTEQAIVHLRRALELDPTDAAIHATLAQVFWRTGEYEMSEDHFKRALSYDPKYSRGRNNYAAFLYERGRYAEAVEQLQAVVADTLYDGRSAAFLNLGKAFQKIGRDADAEEAFKRSARMDTTQWQAVYELADASFKRGDYVAASRYYEQFRRYVPSQAAQSLWLGIQIARVEGDKDAEASYALQLKSRFPNSSEYQQYLNR